LSDIRLGYIIAIRIMGCGNRLAAVCPAGGFFERDFRSKKPQKNILYLFFDIVITNTIKIR
jgi:hypothetical protein